MKKILTTVSVAAAAAMAVLVSAPASAAVGTLILDHKRVHNPQGCYNTTQWPMRVTNHTNTDVLVFTQENCQGPAVDVLVPGRSGMYVYGWSVSVP